MDNNPVIIQDPSHVSSPLPTRAPTPLVYNDSIDTNTMTNVLLIDSIVANNKQLYNSVNANTFPIIYNYNSSTDALLALLRQKFPASSIQRIALAFHDKGNNFMSPFMNGKRLFEESDLEENQTSFTENVSFLISCVKEFHVVNIDFLACNTLQYSNWKSYYSLISLHTLAVIGASNNETGNIKYGGDWVMENTSENVRDLYFNANISNYASTLTLSIITLNGANGNVGLRMNVSDEIEYYNTTTSTWTAIGNGNWPVQFVNSNLSSTLKIVATENLTISISYGDVLGYFIAGSAKITFDGSGNTINIDNITDYPGFIDNYNTLSQAYANIIVQNFTTAVSGSSLVDNGGWLCQSNFGSSALGNQIIGCTNTASIFAASSGGIAGYFVGSGAGSSISFTNCTNTGFIIGQFAGGIAGSNAGSYGSVTFTNCYNSGAITGNSIGGIAGASAGSNNGPGSIPATFINCVNTGDMMGSFSGGIAGPSAGSSGGSATFTNCMNEGALSSLSNGGIAGSDAGNTGSATFTNCRNIAGIDGLNSGGIASSGAGAGTGGSVEFIDCTNNGGISANYGGGIVGPNAGALNGVATLIGCISSGAIIGEGAGGIAGYQFAYNTAETCTISNCYSVAIISGADAGGITGADVGFINGTAYLPKVVDISNCYSLGNISTTCGGICGGTFLGGYAGTPTINITNCYSFGAVTDTGSGIVSTTLEIATNQTNIYVGNGAWSDTAATAPTALTGTPTSLTTGNPGATWTKMVNNTTTPYVLSYFDDQIYSPNSASSASSNYSSSAGVFVDVSDNYNYQIIYTNQISNVETTRVFVAKGSTPYYYSYNSNTFVFTNTNPSTPTEAIDVTITPSNGILSIIVQCFKKGTKILCENEIYRPIEELKIGDLVKTYKHGYRKIIMCTHSSLSEYSKKRVNKLYTYSREKNPDLIEDLHLTGGHSLLLDRLTEEESNDMNQINWHADEFIVEDKYKLLACFSSELCIAAEQNVEIYHFTLEPPENAKPSHVYGIYANGILAESCSQGAAAQSLGKNTMLCDSNTHE